MDAGIGSPGRDMDPGFEAHLRIDGVEFTGDDAALLRAIDDGGSLNAAASALDRSYSRAHERITRLEDAVGPLVRRERGGEGGGGSELTGNARDLLARFVRLQAALSGTAATEEIVLEGRILGRDGELAEVDTPAGRVRALLFEDGDRVQVTVRADAITLHTPATAPPDAGTSARNRFDGTVTAIERNEAIARVAVDIGAPGPVTALVTIDSLERLGLEPGGRVIASFKATATRATPV